MNPKKRTEIDRALFEFLSNDDLIVKVVFLGKVDGLIVNLHAFE